MVKFVSTRIRDVVLSSCLVIFSLVTIDSANWAQLAGDRAQNTAMPYTPDHWHRNSATSIRPMWSARWGHSVVVLNQPAAKSYLTDEENSPGTRGSDPVIVLLGGDDGLPRATRNATSSSEAGIGSGRLRNDVWIGMLAPGSQASWRLDDRYFVEGQAFNSNLLRSQMTWMQVNPGHIAPPLWPSGRSYSKPLTYEEWIACQDSIKYKLIDPSICKDPPVFCYDDIQIPGCKAQAVWKRDNMWSPRRGFGAAVANGKIIVIGGRSREYARIDDSRLVGSIAGQGRVETSRDHSTIREDVILRNDVWSSEDNGLTWKLVNPGCRDHQQDVLIQTEVWSRDLSDPSTRKNVGSLESKCFLPSDCYGIAECKALGTTNEKVCVCPMFSPREHHTLSVQHRFSFREDGSVYEEDVLYVVGGFTSVKQSFCADRSCGPSDGYRVAMDDIWMSTDGVKWVQVKPAFDNHSSFVGRGGHTALVIPASRNDTLDNRERLMVFGGETAEPQDHSTTYLNDVWDLPLPTASCNLLGDNIIVNNCVPSPFDLTAVSTIAEWSKRSGHTSAYEPPSSSNSFRPRIFLSGGKNTLTAFSDVWSWELEVDSKWRCDFCPKSASYGASLGTDQIQNADSYKSVLDIDSPLSWLQNFDLPRLDSAGNLDNLTSYSVSPVVSSDDVSVLASENVNTIHDLYSADLYKILKLRGFDYPGRLFTGVTNVCFLRELSQSFVEKCSSRETSESNFHKNKIQQHQSSELLAKMASTTCGRGGESKPCTAQDWDGCTPIIGMSVVDVHGIGNVKVPEVRHNVLEIVDELICRQVPGNRSSGAAAFIDNKFLLLGGITGDSNHLYRDAWARDEVFPHANIKTRPESRTPQYNFLFDSDKDGAYLFQYKIFKDDEELRPWTTTTKSIGVDVSWLDDKKGGRGKGWYTIYVRAVDPSGNKDVSFSTHSNVYRWYYVPPIPWGAASGGVFTSLILIVGGCIEYRRRKRKASLERFALRKLKRKFKLRSAKQSVQITVHPNINDIGDSTGDQRPVDIAGRKKTESSRRSHDGDHSSRSHSRSHRSRINSISENEQTQRGGQKRNKEPADKDERRRKRSEREKNRRKNLRDHTT